MKLWPIGLQAICISPSHLIMIIFRRWQSGVDEGCSLRSNVRFHLPSRPTSRCASPSPAYLGTDFFPTSSYNCFLQIQDETFAKLLSFVANQRVAGQRRSTSARRQHAPRRNLLRCAKDLFGRALNRQTCANTFVSPVRCSLYWMARCLVLPPVWPAAACAPSTQVAEVVAIELDQVEGELGGIIRDGHHRRERAVPGYKQCPALRHTLHVSARPFRLLSVQ